MGSWNFTDIDKILFVIVVSLAAVAIVLGAVRVWMHLKYGPHHSTTEDGTLRDGGQPKSTDSDDVESAADSSDNSSNASLDGAANKRRESRSRANRHVRLQSKLVDSVLQSIGAFDDDFYVSIERIAVKPSTSGSGGKVAGCGSNVGFATAAAAAGVSRNGAGNGGNRATVVFELEC